MNYHKSPPREGARNGIVAVGSQTKTFWMAAATDGDFQAVTLPAGVECKSVQIQVHDGDDTVYDPDTGNSPFLFSSESDGAGWTRFGNAGFAMSIGKIQAEDGGILGYVNAAAGAKVAVIALY